MIIENSASEHSWGLLISVSSDLRWQRKLSFSSNNSLLPYPLFYYKNVDICICMGHLFQIKQIFFFHCNFFVLSLVFLFDKQGTWALQHLDDHVLKWQDRVKWNICAAGFTMVGQRTKSLPGIHVPMKVEEAQCVFCIAKRRNFTRTAYDDH